MYIVTVNEKSLVWNVQCNGTKRACVNFSQLTNLMCTFDIAKYNFNNGNCCVDCVLGGKVDYAKHSIINYEFRTKALFEQVL